MGRFRPSYIWAIGVFAEIEGLRRRAGYCVRRSENIAIEGVEKDCIIDDKVRREGHGVTEAVIPCSVLNAGKWKYGPPMRKSDDKAISFCLMCSSNVSKRGQ